MGITPACAGNTNRGLRPSRTPRDHPRMRGEYCLCPLQRWVCGGSPPHARGIPLYQSKLCLSSGITPACAGNPLCLPLNRLPFRDHPRMRGEYRNVHPCAPGATGSPPHARGVPSVTLTRLYLPGITPACAGNTGDDVGRGLRERDHPRMRGEYCLLRSPLLQSQGSPPHARGILGIRD